MSEERMRYIRSLETLAPLYAHTDAIDISDEGRVEVRERLSPPVDQYGIPRPEIMIERLLGAMSTKHYVWPGRFDEHHLATPKADFTVIRTNSEGDIGSAFRGLACLKIELPRQMHNFSHAIFELPGRPSVDIMRQAVLEVGQAKRLQLIMNEHLPAYPHVETDQMRRFCIDALQTAFESMVEPEIGMTPSLEEMAIMGLDELRVSMASLLRVRRFSRKYAIHPAIRRHHATRTVTSVA